MQDNELSPHGLQQEELEGRGQQKDDDAQCPQAFRTVSAALRGIGLRRYNDLCSRRHIVAHTQSPEEAKVVVQRRRGAVASRAESEGEVHEAQRRKESATIQLVQVAVIQWP
eukprot:scaffold5636_cov159-Ochromonas_danica.AAC.15